MKKILVPVDFSKLSTSAAHFAADMAKRMNSAVILVSVIENDHANPTLLNWKKLQQQMLDDATRQFAELRADLASYAPEVHVSNNALVGYPFDKVVVDYANDNEVDLIVAGTSGASGLKATVIGSNASALINRSDIPVVVVPGELRYNGFQRIVLATDMKDLNSQLQQVVDFARKFDSQIDILHISEVHTKHPTLGEIEGMLGRKTGYHRINVHVFPGEDVTSSIHEYVKNAGADLLVMFTHELGIFEKLFGKGHTREMSFNTETPLLAFKRADSVS